LGFYVILAMVIWILDYHSGADGLGQWRKRRTVMRRGQGKKIGVHGEENQWA
jgi:hypothetical protein